MEYFPGWVEERQSTQSCKSIQFYAGFICAVFWVKLINMLSNLFHSSCVLQYRATSAIRLAIEAPVHLHGDQTNSVAKLDLC